MEVDRVLEISAFAAVVLAVVSLPVTWWAARVSQRDERVTAGPTPPPSTTGGRGRDTSGTPMAIAIGWVVVFALLVVTQRSLVLSVALVLGLTASTVVTAVLVYRSSNRLHPVPAGAALAVVGLVVLSVVAWGARMTGPVLADEVRIASAAAEEEAELGRTRDDLAARARHQREVTTDLEGRLSRAESDADRALTRYEEAQRLLLCELDGTCGTGVPGRGTKAQALQAGLDRATVDLEDARTAVTTARDQLDQARALLEEVESRLRTVERDLADVRPRASDDALAVQARTLGRELLVSPVVVVALVVIAAAGVLFVRRARKTA